MTTNANVPAGYDGREQAWIKHKLLESYLEKLLLIVGMGGRRGGEIELCYVDCFAGPWGDASDDLSGTSIAVSLQTMEQCRRTLKGHGVSVSMRALYIERDDDAFQRLSRYLAASSPDGIRTECMHGDFLELRERILQWCGRRAFTFFFVDPKGWKSVGVTQLRPLLARPGSEFLINFMYNFINRTASMSSWKQDIAEFLGCDLARVEQLHGLGPDEREQHLLQTYREGLKQAASSKGAGVSTCARTAHVRVMDPERQRPKYHLVYLTTHHKGIVKFMEISERLDLVQRRVLASKRNARQEARSGTADLFGADSFEQATLANNQVEAHVVDAFWIQYLAEGPRRVDETEMATLLESTGWMPGDYQASLGRLIEAGELANADMKAPRRKRYLHYEKGGGETLRLLDPR